MSAAGPFEERDWPLPGIFGVLCGLVPWRRGRRDSGLTSYSGCRILLRAFGGFARTRGGGLWLSWESASFASRRSAVRIRAAPWSGMRTSGFSCLFVFVVLGMGLVATGRSTSGSLGDRIAGLELPGDNMWPLESAKELRISEWMLGFFSGLCPGPNWLCVPPRRAATKSCWGIRHPIFRTG